MFSIFNGQVRGIGENPKQGIFMQVSVEFREYLHYFKGAKLAVFQAIVLHADDKGWSHPSISLLKQETGYEHSTISTAITDLCKTTINDKPVMMAVQQQTGGRFVKNHYLIFPSDEEIKKHAEVLRRPRPKSGHDDRIQFSVSKKPYTENWTESIYQSEEQPVLVKNDTSSLRSDVSVAGSDEPPRTPPNEHVMGEHEMSGNVPEVPDSSTVAKIAIDQTTQTGNKVTPSKQSIEETPLPVPIGFPSMTVDEMNELAKRAGRAAYTGLGEYANSIFHKWWHDLTGHDDFYPSVEFGFRSGWFSAEADDLMSQIDGKRQPKPAPVAVQQDSISGAEFMAMLQRAAGMPSTVVTTGTPAPRRVIADTPAPTGCEWWYSAEGVHTVAHLLKGGKGRPLCKPEHWRVPNKCMAQAAYVLCEECQRVATEPKAAKKPSKDQVLKDAIAVNLQGIAADMATSLTGYLSAKAGGVWRKKLGRDLTAEDYTRIARSFDKGDERGFIKWFRRKCKGCDLPLQPDTFESRYAQYVTELDKPSGGEATINGHITDDLGDIGNDGPFAERPNGK